MTLQYCFHTAYVLAVNRHYFSRAAWQKPLSKRTHQKSRRVSPHMPVIPCQGLELLRGVEYWKQVSRLVLSSCCTRCLNSQWVYAHFTPHILYMQITFINLIKNEKPFLGNCVCNIYSKIVLLLCSGFVGSLHAEWIQGFSSRTQSFGPSTVPSLHQWCLWPTGDRLQCFISLSYCPQCEMVLELL